MLWRPVAHAGGADNELVTAGQVGAEEGGRKGKEEGGKGSGGAEGSRGVDRTHAEVMLLWVVAKW